MFDEITRYIFDRKRFSVDKNAVKPKAFSPPPHNSVFGISELRDSQIWEIGTGHVAKILQRELKARGDLNANAVIDLGLRIVPDEKGHPRHANLEGWPDAKEDQMSVAIDLAAEATLHIIPNFG